MTFAAFSLPFLFVLSAFFSSSETVLFSLTGAQRARIKTKSARADALIGRCLSDQAVLFSTLLVGNTLVKSNCHFNYISNFQLFCFSKHCSIVIIMSCYR